MPKNPNFQCAKYERYIERQLIAILSPLVGKVTVFKRAKNAYSYFLKF